MFYDGDSVRGFACVLGYVAQEKLCVTAVCCSAVDVCCIHQSCDFQLEDYRCVSATLTFGQLSPQNIARK